MIGESVSDNIEETQRQIHQCHTLPHCQECDNDCTKSVTDCPAGFKWKERMNWLKHQVINVAPYHVATREELERHLGGCYDCNGCPEIATCPDRRFSLVQCVHCGEKMQLPYPVDPNYQCDNCGMVWCRIPKVRREVQTTLETF